jgi:hypothetical protein
MPRVGVMKKPRAVTFLFCPQKFPVSQSAPSDLDLKLGSFIIICWICAVGFLPPFFPVLLLHLRNLSRSIESVLLLHLSKYLPLDSSLSFYFISSISPLDSSTFSTSSAQFDRWIQASSLFHVLNLTVGI